MGKYVSNLTVPALFQLTKVDAVDVEVLWGFTPTMPLQWSFLYHLCVWFFVCLEPRNLFSFSMIDFFCGRGDTPKSPSEPSNLDGGFEHFICSPTLLGKLIEINLPHICFILGLVRAPDDIICSPFLQEIGLGTDLEQYAGSHHDDLCLRLVSWKTDFFPGNPLTWMSREGC